MLSPPRDNSALESAYVENYLDCVENLPNDLQRHFSHMLELDVNCQRYLREIDQHQIVLAKSTTSSGSRKFHLAGVQNTLILLQDIGDEKLQLVQKIQELIEKKARQLDVNSRNLRPKVGQENNFPIKVASANAVAATPRPTTATTPTNTNNGTTPTNDKPGRRGRKSKAETANDSGDANVLSENQSSNLPSTSSGPPKKANTVNNVIKKKKRKYTFRNRGRAQSQTDNSNDNNNDEEDDDDDDDDDDSDDSYVHDPSEPVWCYCRRISYGRMIGCDNSSCPLEWFHFRCVAVTSSPRGKWYCPECRGSRPNIMKPKTKFR